MNTRVEKELSSHLILPPLTWFSGGHSSIENDNIFSRIVSFTSEETLFHCITLRRVSLNLDLLLGPGLYTAYQLGEDLFFFPFMTY